MVLEAKNQGPVSKVTRSDSGATLLSTSAVLLVARASFADHYVVPTGSMEPTVAVGDHVCVNKLAYGLRIPVSKSYVAHFDGPSRGDVVVLASPANGDVLLKRVVAAPGDRVTVDEGHVSINGTTAPVRESMGHVVEDLDGRAHPLGTTFGGGPNFGPTRVPDGQYLVLGDNRGNSRDGRDFGWVARDAILGHAVAICGHDGWPVWRPL